MASRLPYLGCRARVMLSFVACEVGREYSFAFVPVREYSFAYGSVRGVLLRWWHCVRVPLRLRACAWVLSGVPALCWSLQCSCFYGLLGRLIVSSLVFLVVFLSPSPGVLQGSSEVA